MATSAGNVLLAALAGRPETSPGQKASRAATLQLIREGTPLDLQQAFADLEADGDVVRATEWDEAEASEAAREEMMDAEVSLADVDDPFHDSWDDDGFHREAATRPMEDAPVESGLAVDSVFELVVRDGSCRFNRPRWMRHRAASPTGHDSLEEAGRRFLLLDRIAEWLNEHRGAFLREADPWHLGCDALAELRADSASVSPRDFLQLAGLRPLAGESLFSRNKKAAVLAWEDGTLPLEFLFGDEARRAWVANAVLQFAAETGVPLSAERLITVERIVVPKEQRSRTALLRLPVASLDFASFIQRANLMAGSQWKAVLAHYRAQLTADL